MHYFPEAKTKTLALESQAGNKQSRERLCAILLVLVKKIVLSTRVPPETDRDELHGHVMEKILPEIRRFDPAKGRAFSFFTNITQTIIRRKLWKDRVKQRPVSLVSIMPQRERDPFELTQELKRLLSKELHNLVYLFVQNQDLKVREFYALSAAYGYDKRTTEKFIRAVRTNARDLKEAVR